MSAAAAAGATDMLMVAFDSGETRRFVEQATEIAENLGVSMDSLVFPATTTDFAPVAAQIADATQKPSDCSSRTPSRS